MFVVHALAQLPAGRISDRVGARTVGTIALAAVAVGNTICLVAPDILLALVGRAIVGVGSGAGFVAGAEYMRQAHASPIGQGLYGGATMSGGGLAIAIVPQLDGLGWRAPYWSALGVAVLAAAVLAIAPSDRREPAPRRRVPVDRQLIGLGVAHAATFGLSVVAANWVVALLERQGHDRGAAAILGALMLLAGILTRPLGGWVIRDRPERARLVLAAALVIFAAAAATLALPLPLPALGAAAGVAGLAAGLPFAAVFNQAQRARSDAPAAAVGFVNAWPAWTIVCGTPLLGLAFSLPGEGRLGFAVVATLVVLTLPALRTARVL